MDLGDTRLDRTSLREQARELLRARIIDGTLPPGERLVETTLSNQLDVSRGTLREAMRALEQEGLVVPDGRGRMRVHALGPREVREVYEVRTSLEVLAAERIAKSSNRDDLVEELHAALLPMKQEGGTFAQIIERDLDFHHHLCRLGGNRTLTGTWHYLCGSIRATIVNAGPTVANPLMAWQRHAVIVDAIESGDEKRIRDTLTAHMNEASLRIAEVVRAAAVGDGEGGRAAL
jgi:DNA-binding GntR family transcriptional regulator